MSLRDLLAICKGMGWSWPELLATPPTVIEEAGHYLVALAEERQR